jgi:deubiquitinating protein VCIP135
MLFRVNLSLSWGGKTKAIDVYWFQYESDPARNSNVYQVASKAVGDHFPGEFGSERLVQQVVDHILRVTENKEGMEQVSGHHPTGEQQSLVQRESPEQVSGQSPTQQSPDSISGELRCLVM